jgi:hypothetical protein
MGHFRYSLLLIAGLSCCGLLIGCKQSNTDTPQTTQSNAGSSSPAVTPTSSYLGAVDYRNCQSIKGWVFNNRDDKEKITVALYIDDKLIGTAPANILRPELKAKNIGTGEYAYSFEIPANFKDGQLHTVMVKTEGSNYTLSNIPNVSPFRCPAQ